MNLAHDTQRDLVIEDAIQLAMQLPPGTLDALARAIEQRTAESPVGSPHALALHVAPQPAQRARVSAFIERWQTQAPLIDAATVALAVRTAARATRRVREEQQMELVWTGPRAIGVAMRRTDQALYEVIEQAQHELLIVSFAVYKIPTLATAIVHAATRGVSVRICVESPEPGGQKRDYTPIQALGDAVTTAARIYIWPTDQRPQDSQGHTGVLHAKCAVADRRLLFISSANLTDYAMNLNMELGVLITGGPEPATVTAQFDHLIAEGVLQRRL